MYAKLREKAWFACSLKSRMQYLVPAPGVPFVSEQQPTEIPTLDPSVGPVGVFCLLVLDPDQVRIQPVVTLQSELVNLTLPRMTNRKYFLQVDYLNLKSDERLIFTAGQNGNGQTHWSVEKVNP